MEQRGLAVLLCASALIASPGTARVLGGERLDAPEPRTLRSTVSGRVVNPRGEGIGGAIVRIWHGIDLPGVAPAEDWGDSVLAETHANRDGYYELTLSVPEEHALRQLGAAYMADGYGTHEEWWTYGTLPPPALRRPDVALGPAEEISGRIVNHKGEPLAGVMVECWPKRTFSDAAGRYRIDGLSADTSVSLWACGVDHEPLSVESATVSPEPPDIRFAS